MWHYTESGEGRPLVLLHGIGMSGSAWNTVMPYLTAFRKVIVFDIAGFGLTPPLPVGINPTSPSLAAALESSMRAMGLVGPVDIAGNSLGGLIAMEAARRGLARSVVAISPPGLWTDHPPLHVKYVFQMLRFLATNVPAALRIVVRTSFLRELAFAVPISVGSRRMPADDAVTAVNDLGAAAGFEDTFACTASPFSGREITVPLTVAFGDRDYLLLKTSRHPEALPAHTRWITMPRWGHVPMWVDPAGVARLILDGAR
ncbi:MAG TPA: alpha/beta hydrolase [Vicinamibacterales bacterium]|jgi:pimeloyl-ACP methyl ester carboxylesterase